MRRKSASDAIFGSRTPVGLAIGAGRVVGGDGVVSRQEERLTLGRSGEWQSAHAAAHSSAVGSKRSRSRSASPRREEVPMAEELRSHGQHVGNNETLAVRRRQRQEALVEGRLESGGGYAWESVQGRSSCGTRAHVSCEGAGVHTAAEAGEAGGRRRESGWDRRFGGDGGGSDGAGFCKFAVPSQMHEPGRGAAGACAASDIGRRERAQHEALLAPCAGRRQKRCSRRAPSHDATADTALLLTFDKILREILHGEQRGALMRTSACVSAAVASAAATTATAPVLSTPECSSRFLCETFCIHDGCESPRCTDGPRVASKRARLLVQNTH